MSMSVCCYQKQFATIAKARAKLAVTIGEDNILAGREGFMPPAVSGVRSAPAFIFKLNDDGENSFRHGIIGTDDFWEYPEVAGGDAEIGVDADDAGQLGQTTTGGTPPPTATGTTTAKP